MKINNGTYRGLNIEIKISEQQVQLIMGNAPWSRRKL